MPLLEVSGLTKRFGGLVAVNDLDFVVNEGEILGLIGPNGAGKTTIFNMISGFLRPTKGRIVFNKENVLHLKSHQRANKGLVRTFQSINLFREFTVFKNISVAHQPYLRKKLWRILLGEISVKREARDVIQSTIEILNYLGLTSLKDELAKNLPHGHQRALGIGVALAAEPKLLLLDEPLTGMNQQEVSAMMALIDGLRERRITIVVVEHNMKAIMGLSDRIVAINFGRKIAEGLPKEIQNNKEVIAAYLGSEELI